MSLKKLFKLPGPSFFVKGVNDYALPLRDLSPETGSETYCWEDYYADLKKVYPVKYFFVYTLVEFLKYKIWFPLSRPLKNTLYWLKCHLVPKHRYHMLDLRQRDYTHGWIDIDTRILYANFNLLNEFVKHEIDNFYCPTEEECNSDECWALSNKKQRAAFFEIMNLHYWWNTRRALDQKKCADARSAWHQRKYKQKIFDEETDRLWQEHLRQDQAFEDLETEMLIRLIKIRNSLWT
jgi:hypothetical protein